MTETNSCAVYLGINSNVGSVAFFVYIQVPGLSRRVASCLFQMCFLLAVTYKTYHSTCSCKYIFVHVSFKWIRILRNLEAQLEHHFFTFPFPTWSTSSGQFECKRLSTTYSQRLWVIFWLLASIQTILCKNGRGNRKCCCHTPEPSVVQN